MDILTTNSVIARNLGIKHDISDDIIQSWKLVQKSALGYTYNNLDDNDNLYVQSHMIFLFQKINDVIGILEPVLGKADFVDDMSYGIFVKHVNSNSYYRTVCNHIYEILSFNKLQRLVVEEIIDYVIKNKRKMQLNTDAQLLLYLCRERGVGKSHIVKTLEIGFTLLD